MNSNVDLTSRLALDVQSVDSLRLQAKQDPLAAVKSAAKQFEAMFLNILFKSMRDATPQDSLFDSSQSRMFTQMLDQQMAQKISTTGKGIGLAEALTQQLMRAYKNNTPPSAQADGKEAQAYPLKVEAAPMPLNQGLPASGLPLSSSSGGDGRKEFVGRLWPHAVEAGQSLGVPPHFLIAQAALESGWGKGEIRGADGKPSYNLFGVKAGAGWKGEVVHAPTTEYVNGQAQATTEPFRAYASYADAFRDYAGLLANNPRYASVLQHSADPNAFAQELQRAGYATDPMYASKLSRIMASNAFREALAG